MRLQPLLGLRQQVTPVENCDYGVEPNADTTMKLVLLIEDDLLRPVVNLHRQGTKPLRLKFDTAFSLPEILKQGQGVIQRLLVEARVEFLQEDPTEPDLFIVVSFGKFVLEQHLMIERVRKFMTFPFEGALDIRHEDTIH